MPPYDNSIRSEVRVLRSQSLPKNVLAGNAVPSISLWETFHIQTVMSTLGHWFSQRDGHSLSHCRLNYLSPPSRTLEAKLCCWQFELRLPLDLGGETAGLEFLSYCEYFLLPCPTKTKSGAYRVVLSLTGCFLSGGEGYAWGLDEYCQQTHWDLIPGSPDWLSLHHSFCIKAVADKPASWGSSWGWRPWG